MNRLHYAWVMVLAGILTLFACLGLGRFALGMLLPAMGGDLDLTYAQMGFISTGNFIGYLLAVVVSGNLSRRLGARTTVFWALVTVGVSMILVSQSSSFIALLLLYGITGIGTGAANIPIMGLVAHWFAPRYRGRAAGSMIIGNGLGIVCSGLLVPWLNLEWGVEGWRIGWLAFGVAVLVIGLLCLWLLRNDPAELGLRPLGETALEGKPREPGPALAPALPSRGLLVHLGSIYFLFGFTYVIYLTFIVTTLIREYGMDEAAAGGFWVVIGLLSICSGPLFGALSDRLGRRSGLVLVFSCQTLAYLLAASGLGSLALLASIGLFGVSAFAIPAIIAATLSDRLPPGQAGSWFGYVTFFFAIGQITGPSLAGLLAESSGSLAGSFLLAAGLTLLAIILTLALKAPAAQPRPVDQVA